MEETPRKVAILGATGSIGRNTLDVIRAWPGLFEVVLLSAGRDEAALAKTGAEFPRAKTTLASRDGEEFCLDAIRGAGANIVVNGISGSAGLRPSLAALESGADLALANKETVVMAWPLAAKLAAKTGAQIIPVDSEHSAIFHLLRMLKAPVTLLLTASGGPFRGYTAERLEAVTVEEAVRHPTWKMGAKISVDSATLANKGLEVIEAVRLFDTPPERVRVVIHPQSVIHSMAAVSGGSIYAQMSSPDMRVPIQAALFHPHSVPEAAPLWGGLDFSSLSLSFSPPDFERFPLLSLAYQALNPASGPLAPVAYNGANEAAVLSFLKGRLPFTGIARAVERALAKPWHGDPSSLEDILTVDKEAREQV